MGKLFKGLLAGAALAMCGSAQASVILELTAGQEARITYDQGGPIFYWTEFGNAIYHVSAFLLIPGMPGTGTQDGYATFRSYTILQDRELGTSGYYDGEGDIIFTMLAGDKLTINLLGNFTGITYRDVPDVITELPEPSTWAMLLIGFGAIGYSLRQRSVATRPARIASQP